MSLFGAGRHPGMAALLSEGRMPGFDGATGWLNSPPLTADDRNAPIAYKGADGSSIHDGVSIRQVSSVRWP